MNYPNGPYPDEMFEEAERREAANKAWEAVEKLYAENGDALKQLADIEKEERMTEDERIKVIQTAIAGIGKYSDALKELAKTEKEELKAELEAKKKENFQLVADACMKEYEEKYQRDVFPVDEHWVYMIGEYFGTGEGQTTCIMMTQATPYGDDYPPDGPDKYKAITYCDEVHAIGLYGDNGAGWLEKINMMDRIDFISAGCGKAYGVGGGYIVGDQLSLDAIRHMSAGFIFTTSISPVICAGVMAAVKL